MQATVTLKHLAAELADCHDIAKKQAEPVARIKTAEDGTKTRVAKSGATITVG